MGCSDSSLEGKNPTLKAEGSLRAKEVEGRGRKKLLELKAKIFVINGDQIEVLFNWKGAGEIQL